MRPKKKAKLDLSTITLGYLDANKDANELQNLTRMRILFDSGCGATLINKNLVHNLETKPCATIKWKTKAGKFKTNEQCKLQFKLPAFHANRDIHWDAYVENTPPTSCRYNMIIGRDLMQEIGLPVDLLFSQNKMQWDNATVPMQPSAYLDPEYIDTFEQELFYVHDPVTTDADRIQAIIDQKYSQADINQVVSGCQLLTPEQKDKLLALLKKFEPVFDGSLGTWKTEPVDLELKDPDCKPYHTRPYPVPQSQYQKLREEVNRLVKYGILRKINRSEWASPQFTIPKPDSTLRSLANFIELNKRIKRKPFPLPKISDMLQQLEGFLYATSLDLNMGYYHILLTPEASKLCTVVFPWGKYEYLRLPMGLCNSPDIFQEKMSDLMEGLEFARAYLDDLLIVSKTSFEEHLDHLEQVLNRLAEAGLKVNVTKSSFCKDQLEYLGYIINRKGIQPAMKKSGGNSCHQHSKNAQRTPALHWHG